MEERRLEDGAERNESPREQTVTVKPCAVFARGKLMSSSSSHYCHDGSDR